MTSSLMKFLVLMSLPTFIYSMSISEGTEPLLMADAALSEDMAQYHLQGLEPEDSALETRRKYKVSGCWCIMRCCWRNHHAKYTTKTKMSGTFTGYAGPNNELFYRYLSLDIMCDTTGEREAIAGAIEHHIKKHGSKVCGTECLHLTPQDGPWNGYLAIGPAESFDHEAYCGPKLSFKHCD
ncbi:hypothetical protein FPSE_08441 [Fusarium pseudograminearum CS3096]|uniref:Secreted protein CSS2 C-terminal domain-containing protein n=1 Tax=Fusarium pseudograminearum (strain CS3096) TaxID=1028729 RepID=K3VF33_FUSPC|nr:hypothetical protein FPSE_08441 [Fusarium pseudograminearum CS3096]EKJ71338.1 hypothetical protein FPSE_08441 [Fusarium pseudograminearum CS3096]